MKSKSINLLPPKTESRSGRWAIVGIIIIGLLTASAQFLFFFNWSSETETLNSERTTLEKEAELIRKEGFPRAEYDAYLRSLQLAERIKSEQRNWPLLLRAIVDPLPSSARVIAISLDQNDSVLADINFKTYEESVAYLKALETDSSLKDIRVTSYSKRVDDTANEAASEDGQTIDLVKPYVFKVQLVLGLNDEKGGAANGQ